MDFDIVGEVTDVEIIAQDGLKSIGTRPMALAATDRRSTGFWTKLMSKATTHSKFVLCVLPSGAEDLPRGILCPSETIRSRYARTQQNAMFTHGDGCPLSLDTATSFAVPRRP